MLNHLNHMVKARKKSGLRVFLLNQLLPAIVVNFAYKTLIKSSIVFMSLIEFVSISLS